MKLSVIIPVYRVERTLNRCVESVLQQQVEDMEVILVDDGSPDHCHEMCDEWAQKDHRIRVIHKENGGLSDARNAGIDMARGYFITFVDSDDWLSPNTYGPLLLMMGDADILEYAVANRLSLTDKLYDNTDEYWLACQAYTHTYAWNKIYRRCLFDNVRYPKGKVFEDVYTLPLLLRQAHKIVTTNKGYYHYCYNPAGITATADGSQLSMLLDAHLSSGMPMDDAYYMHLLNIQMDVWEQTGNEILLPPRTINSHPLKGVVKVKAIALNILGINRLCKINKAIHRIKKPSRW